jgi:hypothetical protein
LVSAYQITATNPGSPGYQSILSLLTEAIVGRGVFYYLTIAAILLVLCLSANTSFADFPRVCRTVSQDGFLPLVFAVRGRRLVYTFCTFRKNRVTVTFPANGALMSNPPLIARAYRHPSW